MKHIPVLLNAVMGELGDIRGAHIVDATFGAGGYSRAFLNAGAYVTAFDRDPNVLTDTDKLHADYGDRFTFIAKPFSHIADLAGKYDAIVFDLGISSMQIDNADRGFSFRFDGPLDMRMDNIVQLTAAQLIEKLSESELANVLREYGDVKKANILARAIKDARPQTTFQLRDLIYTPRDVAPVFQALRIAVNDEFGEIRRALAAVPEKLACDGKCICVTFHSIEDRIVKNTFRAWTTAPGDPRLPIIRPAPFVARPTITPDADELAINPRARSAHMRAVQRVADLNQA